MKIYQKPKYHEHRWKIYIEPFIDKDGADRQFYDIGCNAGFYMRKLKGFGYRTSGIENDIDYLKQAPADLDIEHGDINYKEDFPTSYLTLLACVHYHQTDEQVEALFHKLMYSAANLIVMGRHKGKVASRPDLKHLMSKMRYWKASEPIIVKQFYSIHFENPRYREFDVDELYRSTCDFVSTLKGFDNFVPGFEEFVRLVLSGKDFDIRKTGFMDYLKRRRLIHPLGRCWIYKTLIKNIQENGISKALIVKDGRISDGYHRLIILRELGVKRVICRIQR